MLTDFNKTVLMVASILLILGLIKVVANVANRNAIDNAK